MSEPTMEMEIRQINSFLWVVDVYRNNLLLITGKNAPSERQAYLNAVKDLTQLLQDIGKFEVGRYLFW